MVLIFPHQNVHSTCCKRNNQLKLKNIDLDVPLSFLNLYVKDQTIIISI